MKVIVLGAGITGITTAWYLTRMGHKVTVVDRQAGPAQETSKANGCQISVSHAEPWANPSAPLKILRWLGQEDAPLLYRFKNDPDQWRWCLRFLRECMPRNTDQNIRDIVALADFSRRCLDQLREDLNLEYDQKLNGILHFYTDPKEFKSSLHAAALMRSLGCPRTSISSEEAIAIEPALDRIGHHIVGADYTPTDESGDVYKFCTEMTRHCKAAGVTFMWNTQVTKLVTRCCGDQVKYVETIHHGSHVDLFADKFIVCMGSESKNLLKPLGIDLLIYPGKGYSATYRVTGPGAPVISLTDDEYKLVFSRLGNRLRVAGTCELNGYSRDLNIARCKAITKRTKRLFPEACNYDDVQYWTGLRPMTPSNVPYVGKTKLVNLYLNTGHGTLGWTMGCGSGNAIADIVTFGDFKQLNFRFT